MSRTDVRVATDESFDLAEGPVWDPLRSRLLWVDIRTGTVLTGDLRTDGTISITDRMSFPGFVGAVAVAEEGDLIVANTETLLRRAPDGQVTEVARILAPGTGRRLNDGTTDPAGRYLVGTLALDDSGTTEQLVVVQADGQFTVLDDDLTLSNGLGWSPDGGTLYSTDTYRQRIYARPYDAASGTAGERRVLVTIDGGNPDGMCVDADGCLWVAIWGGGQVRRFSPDGKLLQAIDVPAPHTTCVAFAGPELSTLVITTATKDLTAQQLAEFPLSGRLFTLEPGVRGLPRAWWSPEGIAR